MSACYILYSPRLDKFYTGATQSSVEERLEKHNTHFYGPSHFTSKSSDWTLFLQIEVKTYSQAIRLERKIKSQKSSAYIRNLKKYPDLVEKIIAETA